MKFWLKIKGFKDKPMSYNEAETKYNLIDPVLREKGYVNLLIRLETPAPVEPIGNKGRRRRGSGRTDYLLCVQVGNMPKPLPVAVLEAKKEDEDPYKGMQQAKGYSDCDRFDVKYVFASNGHRYGEFEVIDDSKLPANLTADWLEDETNEGKRFPSYARILAKMATPQGESRYSWTIDFAKRRADARDEMQPHLDKANAIKEDVVIFKEKIKALKKVDTKNPAIKVLEEKISIQEKAARDEEAIASDIDAKVFDLKAVNPNTVIKVDMRTSKEIIENIELHGKIVAEAMKKLSLLMKD